MGLTIYVQVGFRRQAMILVLTLSTLPMCKRPRGVYTSRRFTDNSWCKQDQPSMDWAPEQGASTRDHKRSVITRARVR